MSAYIVLDSNYIVREVDRRERTYNLINWPYEEQFTLDEEQRQIFELTDGTNTLEDIVNICSDQGIDRHSVEEFCNVQIGKGVLRRSDDLNKRIVVKCLPNDIGVKNIRFVQWEVSAKCNQQCQHCYNQNFITNDDLSTKQCFRITDELDQLNNLAVQISGGEPLLRNDLVDLIDCIEDHHMNIRCFFSNGILLDNKIVSKLNNLKSRSQYIMSFDGPDEECYDFLRGKGQYKKLINNLDLLNELKVGINLNVMLHRKNHNRAEEIFAFANKIPRVTSIRFGAPNRNYQGRYGETSNLIGISIKEELEAYKKLLSTYFNEGLCERYNLELSNFFRTAMIDRGILLYHDDQHPCSYVGGWTFTIKPDGNVQWCPTLYQKTYGNVRSNSLLDCYQSNDFLKCAELKLKDIEECRGCKYIKLCGSGCRAMVYPKVEKKDEIACQFMKYFEREVVPILPGKFRDKISESIL